MVIGAVEEARRDFGRLIESDPSLVEQEVFRYWKSWLAGVDVESLQGSKPPIRRPTSRPLVESKGATRFQALLRRPSGGAGRLDPVAPASGS